MLFGCLSQFVGQVDWCYDLCTLYSLTPFPPLGRGHLASQSSWSQALYNQRIVLSHKLLTYFKEVYSKPYHHHNIPSFLSFSYYSFLSQNCQIHHLFQFLSVPMSSLAEKGSLRGFLIVRILGFLIGFKDREALPWTDGRTKKLSDLNFRFKFYFQHVPSEWVSSIVNQI